MANYKVLATWDVSIQNLYKDITLIQQGISCKLNISLRSISRVTVNYKVGNEYVTDLCKIDLDNNKVIVPFKKNVLEVGTHALELVCHMKNGDVLPTPNYSYTVTKSLTNDNDITEEDAYPVLIGMIQELTKNEAIIQANEEARANAEMYRELNEDERQNAEAERKANENIRISNENTRQSNESSRQQYETQRRAEEDERLTDEQVRVNAENIRIANENERLRKEIERQNAEELRQIAYNSSLYGRMDEAEDRLDAVDSQLAHNATTFETLGSEFGILPSNNNNYEYIMNALNFLKSKGGGTLILQDGIKTSPISFKGFSNITIKGISSSLPYSKTYTIKIIGDYKENSVGLQFSDNTYDDNNSPSWSSKGCKLENIYLDCSEVVDFGINCNLNIELNNVCVRYAKKDGIVLENYTYPVYINKVYSQFNKRNGLHIKGNMTTVYSIMDSEFDYNDGLGILIESGAFARIERCLCQGNKGGGYEINYNDKYSSPYFLENLIIDIYTEANEGYQAKIVSYDKTNNALLKAKNIEIRGAINQPNNAKGLNIDGVFGCTLNCFLECDIEINNSNSIGVEMATKPSSASIPNVDNHLYTSYFIENGKIINGMHYSTRGNIETYIFTLESIQPGESKLMLPPYNGITGLGKGMKMFRGGSILGFGLYKGNNNGEVAGTLSIKPRYTYPSYSLFENPTVDFNNLDELVIESDKIQAKKILNVNQFKFAENTILGLRVTASHDYKPGYNSALVGYLVVEY